MKTVVCHWCPCRRLIRLQFRHELKAERSELFKKNQTLIDQFPFICIKCQTLVLQITKIT